jgi:hypothetical protein
MDTAAMNIELAGQTLRRRWPAVNDAASAGAIILGESALF